MELATEYDLGIVFMTMALLFITLVVIMEYRFDQIRRYFAALAEELEQDRKERRGQK
jgi:hypothetical protein